MVGIWFDGPFSFAYETLAHHLTPQNIVEVIAMAQREQRERMKKADSLAEKLLKHKALLVAVMVVIAAACGLGFTSMVASGGDRVQIERVDEGSSSQKRADDTEHVTAKTHGASAQEVFVDIDGAVANPGVYRLSADARISDAIDAAGGLVPEADTTSLNRASKIIDGQKIHVPVAGEPSISPNQSSDDVSDEATADSSGSGLININTATATDLQELPGIGPSTAQAIVDDRTQNGVFSSIEDLMRVSGIGEKKFAKLKNGICV